MTFTLVDTSFELPPEHTAILRINLTAQGEKKLSLLLETSSPTGHSRTQTHRAYVLDDCWTSILIEYVLPLGYEPGACSVMLTGDVEKGGDFELSPTVTPGNLFNYELVPVKNVELIQ